MNIHSLGVRNCRNPIPDPSLVGADFLRHYSLLVDKGQYCLLDALTQLKVQGMVTQDSSPSQTFLPTNAKNEYEASFQQSHNLATAVIHNVIHHITTTGPPVAADYPQNA